MAKPKRFRVLTKTLQIHTVVKDKERYFFLLEDAAQQYRASIDIDEFETLLEKWSGKTPETP